MGRFAFAFATVLSTLSLISFLSIDGTRISIKRYFGDVAFASRPKHNGCSSIHSFSEGHNGEMPKFHLFLNGTDLLLRDIDLDVPGRCGSKKCAYRSKSNRSSGYLISRSDNVRHDIFEFALHLQTKFGIDHSFTAPPQLLQFTAEDGELLSKMRMDSMAKDGENQLKASQCEIFPNCAEHAFTANIQPIEYIGSLEGVLIKSAESRSSLVKNRVRRLFRNTDKLGSYLSHGWPSDVLEEHLNKTAVMIGMHPCLEKDSQAILRKDGHVIHIDFDRCFEDDKKDHKYTLVESIGNLYHAASWLSRSGLGMAERQSTKRAEENDTPGSVLNGTYLADQFDLSFGATCGYHKCAYRDVNNHSIGYLAGFPIAISSPERTYNFTLQMEAQFGIHHTYAGPPRRYRFNVNDAKRISQNRVSEHPGATFCSAFPFCFTEDFTATVQRIYFLDMSKSALVKGRTHVSKEVSKMFRRASHCSDIFNRTEILQTLADHIDRSKRLLEAEPSLWRDLQFVVSTNGLITHIDMDRGSRGYPGYDYTILDDLPEAYVQALNGLDPAYVTD